MFCLTSMTKLRSGRVIQFVPHPMKQREKSTSTRHAAGKEASPPLKSTFAAMTEPTSRIRSCTTDTLGGGAEILRFDLCHSQRREINLRKTRCKPAGYIYVQLLLIIHILFCRDVKKKLDFTVRV